jgi:nucleotide-binding universal stress UspA family protein
VRREGGFDLLVVGSHGRSGPKHLVLGSVAEELVRAAPCPVLVARRSAAQPGAAAAD